MRKTVKLCIQEDTHREIKKSAIDLGLTAGQFVEFLVEHYLGNKKRETADARA